MRLRRWHRLGIILTVIGGLGLFSYVFMRDDDLGQDIYFHQRNECRLAERRGMPADNCYREVERQRADALREKWQEAAVVTAGAIVLAWGAAFASIGLYRWVMAGESSGRSGGDPGGRNGGDPGSGNGSSRRQNRARSRDRSRDRIEPKM